MSEHHLDGAQVRADPLEHLAPEQRARLETRLRASDRAAREEHELPTAAPCPWCGSHRTLVLGYAGRREFDGYQVTCQSRRCDGAGGPARRTVRGAIAAWNARDSWA